MALAQLLQLDFIDKDTGNPVPCRVEPTKAPKRFPKPRAALTNGQTILFEESFKFKPPLGEYEFTASRGIEFADVQGGFKIEKDNEGKFDIVFSHTTKMNSLSWFSGDLASPLPIDSLKRWASSEALNVTVSLAEDAPQGDSSVKPTDTSSTAPKSDALPIASDLETYFSSTTRSYRIAPEPSGVTLVLHPIDPGQQLPPEITSAKSLLDALEAIRSLDRDQWVLELSDIWHRDFPIILAILPVDAVQVMSSHLKRDDSLPVKEAFYNPDPKRFFEVKGLGRLMEYTYWQMLESGLQIAPSSGSHFQPNSKSIVGYNRVYTWIDRSQERTPQTWWRNFKNGFSIITNGPLLRLTVNGQPPGGILKSSASQPIYTQLEADLAVRDEVDYLDIIFNGQTKYQAKLEEYARRGKFPELAYKESGWMLVRVITAHPDGYRLASTAPTYFQFDGQTRISRKAVQFFQTWLDAAVKEISADPALSARYKSAMSDAKRYWMERSLSANVP